MNRFNLPAASLNQMEAARPPAEIRPAETEQEMDIRLFKQEYGEGKKKIATCAAILLRIHQRGEWQGDGLAWGVWAETKLGVDKSHAYAMVRTKNSATDELKAYYQSQAQVASAPPVATGTCDVSKDTKKAKSKSAATTTATSTPPANPANNGATTQRPKSPTDDLGRVIPKRCLELLSRVELELQPFITAASKLHSLCNNLDKFDPLYAFIYEGHRQEVQEHAHQLYKLFSCCKPQRVCPRCDGVSSDKCETCFGAGMISEYRWKHHVLGGTDPKLADKAKAIQAHATS